MVVKYIDTWCGGRRRAPPAGVNEASSHIFQYSLIQFNNTQQHDFSISNCIIIIIISLLCKDVLVLKNLMWGDKGPLVALLELWVQQSLAECPHCLMKRVRRFFFLWLVACIISLLLPRLAVHNCNSQYNIKSLVCTTRLLSSPR